MCKNNFNYEKTLAKYGISYLGSISQSAKMMASYRNGVITYCIYLAPHNMATPNENKTVCAFSEHCAPYCLNGSGRNKADILVHGFKESNINIARIKRTLMWWNNREDFMRLCVHEIKRYRKYAEKMGMGFSVRLNGTSDLNVEQFIDPDSGLNVLQLFSDVQFYDYSKAYARSLYLIKKYKNYDVTLSYDGFNENACRDFLRQGGRVAVVFDTLTGDMPISFCGYKVESGNEFDMRYLNSPKCVIGLRYHRTANDYKSGKYIRPTTPFVVREDDERIGWFI